MDLLASVRTLLHHGLEVQGGFIVGFDSDPQNIFERQISFIQQSGIVTAMVGMLNAPRGTKLYQRLKRENRLLGESTGDNTDFSATLLKEYRLVTSTLFRQPGSLPTAVTLAIYGYHFRKLVEGHCRGTT